MRPRITVFGSANVDFIMQAPHLPALGETVTDCSFLQTFGGKGANQAVAAVRAAGAVTFVGALGNDPYEPIMRENFVSDGMDVTHLLKCDDISSGTALVMFDDQGNNYLTVSPGANYRVSAEYIASLEGVIAASDWIVLQQEIPREANETVLRLAEQHDIAVLFNYAPAQDLTLRPSRAIHGLVVNETEAIALNGKEFDTSDTDAAGAVSLELLGAGEHRFVVVTLGEKGSVIAENGAWQHIPAAPCVPTDATAAGDTFCGYLAVALGEGKSLAHAAMLASQASAMAVSKMGAQPSIPYRNELDASGSDTTPSHDRSGSLAGSNAWGRKSG